MEQGDFVYLVTSLTSKVIVRTWVVTEAHDDGQLTIKYTEAVLKAVADILLVKKQ